MNKLERTPNFTGGEKECLFNTIAMHADVLEDKKTNRTSIEEKNKMWKKIEVQFNNVAPVVQNNWKCFMKIRRSWDRKSQNKKKQVFMTGGGSIPNFKWDPIDEILMQILNEKTVTGVEVPFDCDADLEPVCKKSKINHQAMYEFHPGSALEDTPEELSFLVSEKFASIF